MSAIKVKDLPKGFACGCGVFHRFPAYVYAHWRDPITHTCDDCGAKHSIQMGCVRLIRKGSNDKRKV